MFQFVSRLKFVAAHEVSKLLDDLQAPASIVRHRDTELESWKKSIEMGNSRLNDSTESSAFCRFILLKAQCMELCPQGFQKVIVFLTPHVTSWIQHGFNMYLILSDYLSMKFTIFPGFPSSSNPSDHQTRHPGEKSHPFTVPAQEICCKGKGPCHIAQQSTSGPKRQCGPSQQKCQWPRCHGTRADGLPFGLQEAKAFMASAGLNCSWIFGDCAGQTQVRKCLCAFDCVKQLRGISMTHRKDASCKKVKRQIKRTRRRNLYRHFLSAPWPF